MWEGSELCTSEIVRQFGFGPGAENRAVKTGGRSVRSEDQTLETGIYHCMHAMDGQDGQEKTLVATGHQSSDRHGHVPLVDGR